MSWSRLATAAGAFVALAPSLSAQSITPLPLKSGVATFAIHASKVPDFTGTVTITRAEFRGTDLANVTGVVEIRVADMHTGVGLRDTHMRNAMQADSFPLIRFELVGLDPGTARGDTLPTIYQGHLTIHGVTKTVRVPGTVVIRPGAVDVQVAFPIDMREFGIDPPARFFGAVRVRPVTEIEVRLSFGT